MPDESGRRLGAGLVSLCGTALVIPSIGWPVSRMRIGSSDTWLETFATGGMRYSGVEGSVVVMRWGGLAWVVGLTTLALCAVVAWLLSAGSVSRVLGPAAVAVLAAKVADDVVGREASLTMQGPDLPMELLPAGWAQLAALVLLVLGLLLMFRTAVAEGRRPPASAVTDSAPVHRVDVPHEPQRGPEPRSEPDLQQDPRPDPQRQDPHRFEPPS